MNNAYVRAVEQVADRMHNGNQNQKYYSKDKLARSPKENMGYRSLENKTFRKCRIKCLQMNRFIMLLSNMATRELWIIIMIFRLLMQKSILQIMRENR